MKISKKNFVLEWLIVYFTSKILWDRVVPNFFELLSLMVLLYGALSFFAANIKKSKVTVLVYFLLCAYIVMDALFQDSQQQLFRALYEYCFYFLMFFGMAYYINRSDIDHCLTIVNSWGVIVSLLSWIEYSRKSYILPNNFQQTIKSEYGFRSAVFTRSYLSHAMVLGFFALISLYLYYRYCNKKYLFSCILCASSVLTTSSRGPLVALVVSVIVFYYMNSMRVKKTISKEIVLLLGICLFFAVGLLFLNSTFITGNETVDYFLYRMRQIVNWSGDAGNVGRIGTWKLAFEWFKSNIWFGIGPSHTGSWGGDSIGVTESGYLKFLCELGLAGFSILSGYIFLIIREGAKCYQKLSKQRKLIAIFYLSISLLVMINNITVQSSEEIQVQFIWALGMGGILNMPRLQRLQPDVNNVDKEGHNEKT